MAGLAQDGVDELRLWAWQKIAWQALIGITFSVTALRFADRNGLTPASTRVSFASDTNIDLAFAGAGVGLVLFVLWANFLITAWSNAVNLTDGLDGLATGASTMVFGAYALISVWQFNQSCQYGHREAIAVTCYQVRDPRDMAMISAALITCSLSLGLGQRGVGDHAASKIGRASCRERV